MRKLVIFLTLFIAAMAISTSVAQFHATIDIKYNKGLSETVIEKVYSDKSYPADCYAFALGGLYEFTPQIWAGAGANINISNHQVTEVNTDPYSIIYKPIMQFAPYLTMRYRPFLKHLNAYVFTDLGYAIPFKNTKNFSNGWMWNAGIGYSLMFKKHLGLNFSAGYYMQQIIGTPYYYNPNNRYEIAKNNLRHSIGFAIGMIF